MRKQKGINVVAVIIGLVVVGAAVWTALAIMTHKQKDTRGNPGAMATFESDGKPADDDTVAKIVNSPGQYYGKETTFNAEIMQGYSSRVLQVSNDGTVNNVLLVILPSSLNDGQIDELEAFVASKSNVRVKGTVRQLVAADIESEYHVVLEPAIETQYRSKPVVIASSLVFTSKYDREWKFSSETEAQPQEQP